MGDELKPCPVCHKDGATDRYIRDGRQIFCPHCGWSAPSTFHGPNFEQRLADSWNTRTETQSQATIDELVAGLKPLAALRVPFKPQGNAGAYSIRHSDIERAKDLLAKAGGQS